jgi:hypothetical protein
MLALFLADICCSIAYAGYRALSNYIDKSIAYTSLVCRCRLFPFWMQYWCFVSKMKQERAITMPA